MNITTTDALEVLAHALDRNGGAVTLDRMSATLILSELADLRGTLADMLSRDDLGATLARACQEADEYRTKYEAALSEAHRLRRQLAGVRRALAERQLELEEKGAPATPQ